jgi:hypothetical protein
VIDVKATVLFICLLCLESSVCLANNQRHKKTLHKENTELSFDGCNLTNQVLLDGVELNSDG